MNNNLLLKRIGAFLIDYILVTFITAALIYIPFINPKYDEYMTYHEEYSKAEEDYLNQNITLEEVNEKMNALSYDLNRTGYVYIIGTITITILYYGVFTYFTKGQTLGKKLMKIRIVSNKDKNLKVYNYVVRAIIINGIIDNLLILIAIMFSRSTYKSILFYGNYAISILELIIFFMIAFTKNGRGLHDLIAGTKVVSANIEESTTKVIEAKDVKENN